MKGQRRAKHPMQQYTNQVPERSNPVDNSSIFRHEVNLAFWYWDGHGLSISLRMQVVHRRRAMECWWANRCTGFKRKCLAAPKAAGNHIKPTSEM